MQLPKFVRFDKFVECCNSLIKLDYEEKLTLAFEFYDHDAIEKISITD